MLDGEFHRSSVGNFACVLNTDVQYIELCSRHLKGELNPSLHHSTVLWGDIHPSSKKSRARVKFTLQKLFNAEIQRVIFTQKRTLKIKCKIHPSKSSYAENQMVKFILQNCRM